MWASSPTKCLPIGFRRAACPHAAVMVRWLSGGGLRAARPTGGLQEVRWGGDTRACHPTRTFVGQGPCALPGVGLPGSGVRAPRPTHHLPIEFHKGRRPPTVVPTDSRPLSCPLIGALSRNYPASLHILLCVVGCDMSIAPHDRRRGYSCYAKATQAGRALRWIESKTMQKHGAFGLKSKSPAEPGGVFGCQYKKKALGNGRGS